MSQLHNLKSVYPLVASLYKITPDPMEFEDVAMTAWKMINHKNTRLYRYVGDTDEHGVLELPCNAEVIESVHIPVADTQWTTTTDSFVNYNNIYTEHYIEAWPSQHDNPYYNKGKLVDYKEGDGVLYFQHPYHHVMVIYHGILVDEEEGLPLINDREQMAIAAYVAYAELYSDALRKRDMNAMRLAKDVYNDWLRKCNNARIPEHLSQNDMNAVLDVKARWDRKGFGKSFKPMM